MFPLFTQEEFEKSKSREKLPLKCEHCSATFYKTRHDIMDAHNPLQNASARFCSRACVSRHTTKKMVVSCRNCGLEVCRNPFESKKSVNHFCSRKCAATFNNQNKTYGSRRSKLEIFIEEELGSLYPNLEIHFNRKDSINSELDIYIPSLRLAFELNGIFHYEPIYGYEKLHQIQANDRRKFQACLHEQINLYIIDNSKLKRFTSKRGEEFLIIITQLINSRL